MLLDQPGAKTVGQFSPPDQQLLDDCEAKFFPPSDAPDGIIEDKEENCFRWSGFILRGLQGLGRSTEHCTVYTVVIVL